MTYLDIFHVFQMLFSDLPDANKVWEEVEVFIKKDICEKNKRVNACRRYK